VYPDGQCERALELWDDLRSSGLELSIQAYTTAISACTPLRDADRAASLFNDMRKERIVPDCHAYTALVQAHGSQGKWKTGQRVRLPLLPSYPFSNS